MRGDYQRLVALARLPFKNGFAPFTVLLHHRRLHAGGLNRGVSYYLDVGHSVGGHFVQGDRNLATFCLYGLVHAVQIAHTLLRSDPGTSRLTPAGAVENTDLYSEFCGGLEGGMHHLPPLGGKYLDVTPGKVSGDVANECPVDSHRLHGLQVLDDTLFGDIVVYPVPIHRQFHVIRLLETLLDNLKGFVGAECGGVFILRY